MGPKTDKDKSAQKTAPASQPGNSGYQNRDKLIEMVEEQKRLVEDLKKQLKGAPLTFETMQTLLDGLKDQLSQEVNKAVGQVEERCELVEHEVDEVKKRQDTVENTVVQSGKDLNDTLRSKKHLVLHELPEMLRGESLTELAYRKLMEVDTGLKQYEVPHARPLGKERNWTRLLVMVISEHRRESIVALAAANGQKFVRRGYTPNERLNNKAAYLLHEECKAKNLIAIDQKHEVKRIDGVPTLVVSKK